jgi:hypothetical protein
VLCYVRSNYDIPFSKQNLDKNWYEDPVSDRNVQWTTSPINSFARNTIYFCHERIYTVYLKFIKG